jgi:hypothetical protein
MSAFQVVVSVQAGEVSSGLARIDFIFHSSSKGRWPTSLDTKFVLRVSGAASESVPPMICLTFPSWRSIQGLKQDRRDMVWEERGQVMRRADLIRTANDVKDALLRLRPLLDKLNIKTTNFKILSIFQ